MFSSSHIELSKAALAKNLRFLRKELGKDVIISSVIKGNAYGHGIDVFVPLAESCGVRHFSVFDAGEAFKAKKALTKNSDIMIMGDITDEAMGWAIENGIAFYIFVLSRLERTIAISRKLGIKAKVHLELETGLNRTGLEDVWLDNAANLVINNQDCLSVEGVCTHFAGAENIANYKRIQDQIWLFNDQCKLLRKKGVPFNLRHTASSAAALNYPETVMDMVRIGIAQYGFWPSKETKMHYVLQVNGKMKRRYVDPLKQVICWKSHVMSVKNVKQGEFVGYGTSYLTMRQQKIATIPVGYFHGFRRSLSNFGKVLIHGKRANIVGNVNMNVIIVNVSEISNVEIGDEVVIIGKQKNSQITISSFSDMSNLLNYEALVRLSPDIPRVVVK